MKKGLLLFLAVIMLSGCEPESKDIGGNYTMPEGLEDCHVYRLDPGLGKILYVVRCPNSQTTTSYTENKNTTSNSVVEQ